MRQIHGSCLLAAHHTCPGSVLDMGDRWPCLCPCHYGAMLDDEQDDEQDDDDHQAPHYDRAQPAGLRGATDARRLLLTLVLAALLYLALCALSSALSSAAANAAAPILYP